MPSINYAVNVQVTGGPKLAVTRSLVVDAYDVIDLSIKKNSAASVEVEPGVAGRVRLVLITADTYDNLTYESAGKDHALDGPALLVGAGAVALLDPKGTVKFTNKHATEPRTIHVFVGRNVVAP
jgi:hypothetical protein